MFIAIFLITSIHYLVQIYMYKNILTQRAYIANGTVLSLSLQQMCGIAWR